MEHKSNSYKVNRQQREKVLRFSIRKYSFGAASVAVAALMFLGARVASADSVSETTAQSTASVVNPTEKDKSPVGTKEISENKVEVANDSLENKGTAITENSATTVDKTKLRKVVEELNSLLSTKLNLNDSVVSPIKDRLQKGKEALENSDLAQKDIDELVEVLSKYVTVLSAAAKESTEIQGNKTEKQADNLASASSSEVRASEEIQTVSAKKDSLKVSVDQLKAAILEVPEHDTTKEVLKKANEIMVLAQGVLQNTTVSLTDVEQMNKLVKRMFISVKNATTRLSSGARDSRNGQRMARGTQFRAYTAISSSGALENVRYFASVDKNTNGGQNTRNGDSEFTEDKTVIKSRYEQDSSGKWMVYDVYFNNNGRRMIDKSYGQHYYFQPPFNIMDGSTVQNVTITRYRNVSGRRLSDGGSGFEKVGDTVTISNPWEQKDHLFSNDGRSLYDPRSGVTRANQKGEVFKNNANDPYLDAIVKKTDGNYTGRVSYTLGMEVGYVNADYAVHMTARVKLRGNVTEKEAANGNVYAASVTSGPTTNQSYIVGARGTRLVSKPATPTITTETRYNGTLVSTDRRISGTGIAGATVTVTLQDGKTGTTTVDNHGRWTYNLKDNETLTQNTKQDASIKASKAISVTQTKDGLESDAATVNVQLAKAISIDTPVQAG
ncbi:MAG: YSIRK-type signal peptide-containing protein, partial [Streptococcus mitis]|nr:YSIRK-type signal peptide-containing protein [Streptococcus mitis]